MKSTPVFRCRSKADSSAGITGFTLVEMLVAIFVLAILLGLLTSVFGLVNSSYLLGKSAASNFTKARTSLDIMTLDYQLGVFRPDVPAFTGGSNIFYTLRQASSTVGDMPRSLICYRVSTTATGSVLQRSADQVETFPFNQTTMPTPGNFQDLVNGVLVMQLSFVGPDGSLSTVYATGDKAVAIDLATADDATMGILAASGKLGTLISDPAFSISPGPPVDADSLSKLAGQFHACHGSTESHQLRQLPGQCPLRRPIFRTLCSITLGSARNSSSAGGARAAWR